MENREALIQQTVQKLQSVKTADDLKNNKEEIMDLIERIFKTAIMALKDFFENMFSMSPEEQQEGSMKFQDQNYLLSPEIEKELERLDQIPGGEEYAEEFGNEMEKRLGPFIEEYTQQMQKMMDQFMSGMAEGMAQAFGGEEEVEEEQDYFEFDYNNPDTPVMLYSLYYARTLDELKESKEEIIQAIEEQLQDDSFLMEFVTEIPKDEMVDHDFESIKKVRKHMERLEPEMEKEFSRLSELPDAAEEVEQIKTEIANRIRRKVAPVKGYLRRVENLEIT